jgi:hypothetical protein
MNVNINKLGSAVNYRGVVQNEVNGNEKFDRGDIVSVCWLFPTGCLLAYRNNSDQPTYFGDFEIRKDSSPVSSQPLL